MNKEYRIVEKWSEFHKKKMFYPQHKKLFFWRSLKIHSEQTLETYFHTYEEAKEFLDSRMPKVFYHYVCIKDPGLDKEKICFIKN